MSTQTGEVPDRHSIKYHISGGSANDDPFTSFGGVMSTSTTIDTLSASLLNNLFKSFTAEEALAGATKYSMLYIVNETGQDIKNSKIWTNGTQSVDSSLAISFGQAAISDTEPISIPNADTAPAGITFSLSTGKFDSPLTVSGTWQQNWKRSLWLRLRVLPAADSFAWDNFRLFTAADWVTSFA